MSAPRVVVLGSDHPSSLGIIQSFGRMGASVAAVDHLPNARGFRSRFVTSRHVIGSALEDVWQVLEELRPQGGVLLPTDDHYLTAISQRAESLASSYVVPVPSWDVMGTLLRRARCFEQARDAGLRTPTFHAFADAAEMDAAIARLDPTLHQGVGSGPARHRARLPRRTGAHRADSGHHGDPARKLR